MPQSTLRIALYGGTFDPVHHGHLMLARDAVEQLELERVIFIPAALSPHKLGRTPADGALRRAMLVAALADEPRFALDDSELQRPGPSFAIDTVERAAAQFPGAQLHYLIGADNVRELHTWRGFDDLRRLVHFVVFGRGADAVDEIYRFPTLARHIDISATEIRARVARGASIRYFTPEPVRSIIADHHLYQEPPIESEQLARLCAHYAAEKKAEDLVVLDLRGISTFTDFFVICSGTSDPHLKAIAGELHDQIKTKHSVTPMAIDGYPTSQWIVADYSDVVVHIFHHEKRGVYSLEDLWSDAPRLKLEP